MSDIRLIAIIICFSVFSFTIIYFVYAYVSNSNITIIALLKKANQKILKFIMSTKANDIHSRQISKMVSKKPKISIPKLVEIVYAVKARRAKAKQQETLRLIYLNFYKKHLAVMKKCGRNSEDIEAFLLKASNYIKKEFTCEEIYTIYLRHKDKKNIS